MFDFSVDTISQLSTTGQIEVYGGLAFVAFLIFMLGWVQLKRVIYS